MILVLLVSDEEENNRIQVLNLEMYAGTSVVVRDNDRDAISLLDSLKEVKLIICKNRIDSVETAQKLCVYLKNSDRNIPMIVLGHEDNLASNVLFLEKNPEIKMLIQTVAKELGITSKQMASQVVPDYYPLSIDYFKLIKSSICDVFLQTINDSQESSYTQCFICEEEIEKSKIENLIQEGVTTLFVPAQFRLKFTKSLTENIVELLDTDDLENRIHATSVTMDYVQGELREHGLSDEIVVVSNAAIKAIHNTISSEPKLVNVLKSLIRNKTSYLYKLCQVTSYVCSHAINAMDWRSDEQIQKLLFVAFFHDLALETEEMARINNNKDLLNSSMPKHEKEIVKKHAKLAVDFISKYPSIPIGADTIIRQHHGTDKAGFVEDYLSNISPLAIIFVVAEEFSRLVLDSPANEFNKKVAIKNLEEKFTSPKYRNVIASLNSLEI